MGLESQIEVGLKALILAQLSTDGITASIRASLIDDTVAEDAEIISYPYVLIACNPAIPQWMQSPFVDCSVTILVATHAMDDTKRTDLLALYDSVRTVVDNGDLSPYVTSAGWAGIIVDATEGVTMDGNDQSMSLTCTNRLCGYVYS